LPGVDLDEVELSIEDGTLVVTGRRMLPDAFRNAVIHRLELPQGRFERRVPLPPGRYEAVQRAAKNGCVVLSLRKAA
jgi:HSP20 family molecular chaperone IbpA